jgi:hypothetical protein
MAVFPTVGQVGAAYLQNGVDHGSLRPDLDVAATADDITGMMLAAVIGSLRSGHDSDARARLRDAGRRRSEPAAGDSV